MIRNALPSFFCLAFVWSLIETGPSEAALPLAGTNISNKVSADTIIFRMTCFPDSVGSMTLIDGNDTTIIVTSLAGPVSPEGLVAYFPLGAGFEDDGMTLDMSGFGNHAIVAGDEDGIPLTSDRCFDAGGALFFDNSNSLTGDTIIIPHSNLYNAPSFSVSIWIKKKNDLLVNGVDKILQKGNPNSYDPRTISLEIKNDELFPPWDIQMNSMTIPQDTCTCINCQCTESETLIVPGAVLPDEWHLITGVTEYIPAANHTIQRLYLDSILSATDTIVGRVVYNTGPLVLGNTFNYTTHCCRNFNGTLDEFRLYNRVLSQAEIEKLYLDRCSFCLNKYTYKTTCEPSLVSTSPEIDSLVGDTLYQTVTSFQRPFDISHEGLAIYLPMGAEFGDAGNVSDMSGFGNPVIVYGELNFSPDRCMDESGALSLDADRIELAHQDIYNTSDFSFSIWIKKADDTIHWADKIIEKGPYTARTLNVELNTHEGAADSLSAPAPWNLQMNGVICPQQPCTGGTQDTDDLRLDSIIYPSVWHFVAGTVEYIEEIGSTRQLLYFDGLPADTFTLPGSVLQNSVPFTIGNTRYLHDPEHGFSGDLDEFRFYTRILSPEEILKLYQYKPCPGMQDITLCFGDSIALKNGTYSMPGNYLDTMLTVQGCDSLVVNLAITPFQSTHLNFSVCANELLILHGDTIAFEVDSLPIVLENMGTFGCDSTLFVTRHNLPTIQLTLSDTRCWEDTLFVNNHAYFNQNPTGTEVLTRSNGCDSVVIVDLTFREQALSLHHIQLCENLDTFILNEFLDCGKDTSFIFYNAGQHGCDSSVRVMISCLPVYDYLIDTLLFHTDTLNVAGVSYRFANTFTSSGSHQIQSAAGCDSTIAVTIHWQIQQEDKFPEAITPNDDNINDVFVVPLLLNAPSNYPGCQLVILNRYGQACFHSGIPYQNDWGGLNDAQQPLPAGTYIYIFYLDGKPSNARIGNVTIIR